MHKATQISLAAEIFTVEATHKLAQCKIQMEWKGILYLQFKGLQISRKLFRIYTLSSK